MRTSQDQLEDALTRAQQIEAERTLLEENMKREQEEAAQRKVETLQAVLGTTSDAKAEQAEDTTGKEEQFVPEVKIVSSQDEADKEGSGPSLLDML